MSKAENFIQEHTRNCSNDWYDDLSHGYEPWLTPDQARRAVEIAREEIIEKSCELLSKMILEITYIDSDNNSLEHYEKNEFIEQIKQAMKHE